MNLEGVEIVRPFWPGEDYKNFDYPEGCLVLDNPPFSILAQIKRFYVERCIKFFLFAPSLTLANSAKELDVSYIVAHGDVIYENGAKVRTSFVTNLDCDGIRVWVAGDLYQQIKEAQEKEAQEKKVLPTYCYPSNVTSSALLGKIAVKGITLKLKKESVAFVSQLDSQKGKDKNIFGGGWLLSEKAAAEKAAAEKAFAEKAAETEIIYWEISEREKDIIKNLK